MKEKIKKNKGFIQIPLLVAIIVFVIVATGTSYSGFEYYKTSKLVKEADQLTEEEKYEEAIGKLNLAQVNWFVKNSGIKKQEISDKQEENKKLSEELSIYNQGLNGFDKENYQEAIDLFSEIPEDSFYSNNAKLKTEEAKRKIVEEELGETKIAKKEAEEKAKEEAAKRAEEEAKRAQEELDRKIAEQKLSEKEAEEQRLNADSDKDGLTLREEQKSGTSDWDSDSDDDGIPDGEDTHPAGGGRNIAQTFAWSYGGHNWTWTEPIQEDWYDYYKAKPRVSPESVEYITSDDPFIKKISKKISEGAKSDIHETWLAVSFVQNLPYVDDVFTGYDEYPKYPIETFFEKNGDCEDTSYLAASIIDAMGYGSVLILLPGHMAVGVYMDCNTPGTYYEFDGRCYYYVETTSKDWAAGEIPDRYRNVLATLIKVSSSETTTVYPKYKKPCDSSSLYSGYYYDGNNYYSDNQCNNLVYCLPYEDLYYNYRTESFYWNSGCNQIVVKGCSKSKTYSGKFYKSGSAWYYDSKCTQVYKSMACNYPSSWVYTCTYESSYDFKKDTCDYYASSEFFQDSAEECYEELAKCRNDINEYQRKLDEYNQCKDRKEY